MGIEQNASIIEQAVAQALSGFAAVLPEVISTVQAGGKNVGADFSLAEDLAQVFATAAGNVGGTTQAVATGIEAWLPFTRAVTTSVATTLAGAGSTQAPAPAPAPAPAVS